MLGTSFEFLTTRKVISGRKQFRNTHNLEKSDFFVEIFFDIFDNFTRNFFEKNRKKIFFFEIDLELSETRFERKKNFFWYR